MKFLVQLFLLSVLCIGLSSCEYYDSFRFQWWWEDSYSRNLVLDYGRYGGISYMDDVRVSGNQLWGTFFFSDDSPGFNFTLYME